MTENLRTENLELKVLVVEDSVDALTMMKLWLGTFGCEVHTAANAKDGVALAKAQRPDLIISDIGMPGMDGYQLMRMIRSEASLANIPAIALTGYAREEDISLAIEAGYNGHVSKPTDMTELLGLITSLTKERER